ncbi:hypothetical protein H5410_053300, partial [Solanum commersonii]
SSRSFVEDLTASQYIWRILRSCITVSAYTSSSMAPDQNSEIPTNTAQSAGNSHHSGSNFKPQKQSNNNLYCDYCNWKGHTRVVCFRLHGYPANWKGKRRTSPRPIIAANLARGVSNQHNEVDGHGSFNIGIGNPNTSRSQMQHRSSQPSSSHWETSLVRRADSGEERQWKGKGKLVKAYLKGQGKKYGT